MVFVEQYGNSIDECRSVVSIFRFFFVVTIVDDDDDEDRIGFLLRIILVVVSAAGYKDDEGLGEIIVPG